MQKRVPEVIMSEIRLDQSETFHTSPFAIDGVPEEVGRLHGVELKMLFEPLVQKNILDGVKEWFDANKEAIPAIGLLLEIDRIVANVQSSHDTAEAKFQRFGLELSPNVVELCDAIIRDSESDSALQDRNVKFVFERTGASTHDEDRGFHADTRQVYWNDQGQRIGYDPVRSLPKYMVYVDRPGTILIHGEIDPSLTYQEAILLGSPHRVADDGITVTQDGYDTPIISQLLPQSIYKVSVGQLLHSPPAHEDGLLITASFNN
jgi:hypothetical protein